MDKSKHYAVFSYSKARDLNNLLTKYGYKYGYDFSLLDYYSDGSVKTIITFY